MTQTQGVRMKKRAQPGEFVETEIIEALAVSWEVAS